MSIHYEIPENLPIEAFLPPLLRAEDTLARLDERARTLPFRDGWARRLLYGEACACELAKGNLSSISKIWCCWTPAPLPAS